MKKEGEVCVQWMNGDENEAVITMLVKDETFHPV